VNIGQWEIDTPTAAALTVIGLIFYGLAIHRLTAKRERARAARHRCPPPTIKVVPREHDPWKPQPWMRVDNLEEPAT
jgi:hypothetical protein